MGSDDIVAELDRCLVALPRATVSHALLQRARDEIVALRARLREQNAIGVTLENAHAATRIARAEALADCIRICPECANRIKALNTVGARHLRGERP